MAALEFSLVIVPFITLLFGIIEATLIFFASSTLENGMDDVARHIRTGQVQAGEMSAEAVRTILCDRVSAILKCSDELIIDVRRFDSFSTVTTGPVLDAGGVLTITPEFDPGGAGDIVLVRVFYVWPVLTPLLDASLSNMDGNNRLLSAAAVFRNEPFGSILPEN